MSKIKFLSTAVCTALSFGLILIIASCSTEKENAFFIEYFSQFPKSSETYIRESASRSVILEKEDLIQIINLAYDNIEEYSQASEPYESSTLIYDRANSRGVRLGASKECKHLIILTDNSLLCNKDLYSEIWDILDRYNS